MPKLNLLINLAPSFFVAPVLEPVWERLSQFSEIRRGSHNTAEEFAPDLAWADAVLMWAWPTWTPALLDQAPRLRFSGHLDISQAGARVALDHGLPVSVVRRAFSPAVSEMALSLILTCLRKTSHYHMAMRDGKEAWVEDFPGDIDPDERQLSGRPVGIVGFGGVGQGLASLLAPFGCPLRVYDPFLPENIAAKFGAQRVELAELLRQSEIVVLCAASNEGTRKLLGAAEIALLRPKSVLVNVARAALVDTDALIARLRQNDLYAALDVFDVEPLSLDSPLRKLPNAFLTPHRAGGLLSSVERLLTSLADDLEAYFEDRPRAYALTEAMLPSLDR
ncbi:MAG: hydroxyacid dehydrogenase [Armatimonadota bacterium]|nr:hydroxyacid dehydrogenase [Armatimonadota bacterium]